jgi:hypothetical protein
MQKYQGNSTNAPRETFIGDQRHMLAYINPFEEDLLRNYGGTGQAGPGGVPAFRPVKGKDSSGKSSAGTGFSGGSSNNNSGGGGGGNDPGEIIPVPAVTAVKMGLPVIRCLLVDQVIMIKPTLIV